MVISCTKRRILSKKVGFFFVVFFVFLLLPAFASAAYTETYDNGATSNQNQGPSAGGNYWVANFSVGSNTNVEIIDLDFSKVGNPTYTVNVSLQTSSGGLPSGTLACANSYGTLAASSISAGSFTATNITLEDACTLTASTEYFVVVDLAGSYIDGSNYFNYPFDNTNPNSASQIWLSGSGVFSSWTAYPTRDMEFSFWYNGSSNFTITATDAYTGGVISNFNATVTYNGTTTNYTSASGSVTTDIILANNNANITVTANNYFTNTTLSVNTSSNYEATLTPYTAIYAEEVDSAATVNNFTITYNGTEYSTTSGVAYIPLYNVTDANISIDATGYAIESALVTANPYLQNYTFILYGQNTISFFFRDETTNELINDTITVYITGLIESYNYTTSTGTLNATLLEPDDYVITYSAAGYEQREYTFTLTNRTYNELTLYLLNSSEATLIIGTIYDTLANTVQNATIKAQRKNLSGTNYYDVEHCVTNVNGQCGMHLVQDTVTYRFIVLYEEVARRTTSDTKLYTAAYTITINLEDDTLTAVFDSIGVTGDVTHNNNTNTFTYTWNDASNLGITGCLEVYGVSANGERTLLQTNCSTSATYTVTAVENGTGYQELLAIGTISSSVGERVIDEFGLTLEYLAESLGDYGLFLFGFIVLLSAVFAALWNPSAAAIAVGALTVIFKAVGLLAFSWAGVGGVVMISIVVLVLGVNRS